MTVETQPLRADAKRNLERVVEAAHEVFGEQGIDAPISAIAERAGVGMGTIFRRFPFKDELLAAVLLHRGDQLSAALREALAADDAGRAFSDFLAGGIEAQVQDRYLCDAIGTDLLAREDVAALFDEAHTGLAQLLRRAQDEGAIRQDVTVEDLLFVVHGVAHVGLMLEEVAPGAWRRHLGLALDGLRPEAATPLPRRPISRPQFLAARCGS